MLQKVESWVGCPDGHTQRLLWIYSPEYAGVSGNERVDRLASTADITSCLLFGLEVLIGPIYTATPGSMRPKSRKLSSRTP